MERAGGSFTERAAFPALRADGRPSLIGHRGCAAERPENTLFAIEAAAGVVDAVEIDVRRCGTGELVVIHDASLGRLTDSSGSVGDLDCATVRSANVLGTDETVPLLAETFEAAPDSLGLVLELKEPGLAGDVIDLARRSANEVLLASFRREVLEEVRSIDRSIPLAYTVRESRRNRFLRPAIPGSPAWLYFPENVDRMIEIARRYDCTSIHPRYELCLRTTLVERAHDVGIRVAPWTIDSIAEYEALAEVGVDAVVTDVCSGLSTE